MIIRRIRVVLLLLLHKVRVLVEIREVLLLSESFAIYYAPEGFLRNLRRRTSYVPLTSFIYAFNILSKKLLLLLLIKPEF